MHSIQERPARQEADIRDLFGKSRAVPVKFPADFIARCLQIQYAKCYLPGAYNDGAYLITSEYLFSQVISLTIAGPQLTRLAALLSQQANVLGKSELSRILRDKFRDHDGETPLIPAMIRALEAL